MTSAELRAAAERAERFPAGQKNYFLVGPTPTTRVDEAARLLALDPGLSEYG